MTAAERARINRIRVAASLPPLRAYGRTGRKSAKPVVEASTRLSVRGRLVRLGARLLTHAPDEQQVIRPQGRQRPDSQDPAGTLAVGCAGVLAA